MKDRLKISFIVPGFRCDDTIQRNLDSIFDQDYKNYEIIVVLNGEWSTKKELINSIRMKYGENVQVVDEHEPGLANANNIGFTKSTGDVISHLSSDLYLMPGAVTTWIEAFEDHPDCGLVYSGYRFVSSDPSMVYYSNPFNLYHLQCENYIDGASPYRRQFAPHWNTTLKSLIDWDAMLQVAEKTNAYYIKEPLYYAELPKPGGLSDDSNRNWIARWKAVRHLHNIPDREICITSLDYPHEALALAEMTGCDFRSNPGHKPHEYRLIYVYGFNCGIERIQMNTSLFMRHVGHKIIHWVGPDIREMIKMRWVDVDYYTAMVLKKMNHHWCFTFRDKEILRKVGLEADIVFPPISWSNKVKTLKDVVSVNDPALHDELTKAMPDQTIVMNDPEARIQIFFEGDPRDIIHSVGMGAFTISTIPIEGTIYVQGFTNVPELRKMLVHEVRRASKGYSEKADQETIDSMRSRTNFKKFKERLEKISAEKIHKYGRLSDIGELVS